MRPATPTLAELAAQAQSQDGNNQVQLASYQTGAEAPAQPPAEPERRMMTTSISLPENFRVQGGGSPPTAPAAEVQLPNNRYAMPQALPPNYGAVAAPIGVPQPGFSNVRAPANPTQQLQQLPQVPVGYPTFMTPPQSPLGNGFVAPLGPPQFGSNSVPNSVGTDRGSAAGTDDAGSAAAHDGRRLGRGQLCSWGGSGGVNGGCWATVIWFSTAITPGSISTSCSITSRWLSLAATPRKTTVSPTISTSGAAMLRWVSTFSSRPRTAVRHRGRSHGRTIERDVEPHADGQHDVLFLRGVAAAIAAAHRAIELLHELVRVAAELIEDRCHVGAVATDEVLGHLVGSCPSSSGRSRSRRATRCRSRPCRCRSHSCRPFPCRHPCRHPCHPCRRSSHSCR